jgi:hypothetical protein
MVVNRQSNLSQMTWQQAAEDTRYLNGKTVGIGKASHLRSSSPVQNRLQKFKEIVYCHNFPQAAGPGVRNI